MGDGTSSGGYWTLCINSDGTQLTFATATNGTTTTYFTGAISWATNRMALQIALTYSPSGTALYVDGAALQSGSGVDEVIPSLAARAANGFSLGGNRSGGELALGSFDELETFNYPLSGDDVAANYNGILDPTSIPLSVSFTNTYVQVTSGDRHRQWRRFRQHGRPRERHQFQLMKVSVLTGQVTGDEGPGRNVKNGVSADVGQRVVMTWTRVKAALGQVIRQSFL